MAAMAGHWSYPSSAMWVLGHNIPALGAGGIQGGQSRHASGMQLVGNCVKNVGRLPSHTVFEMFVTLTGKTYAPAHERVDAVYVVAVLGGSVESINTARQWYNRLGAMGWSSAFTPGQSSIVAGAKQGKEQDVGSSQVPLVVRRCCPTRCQPLAVGWQQPVGQ